jgi:pre-rRNA-processing protein TSR3
LTFTQVAKTPRIFTVELRQDDPAKCTSAKMRKFGLARQINRFGIPNSALVLNPGAERNIVATDREAALKAGLVVIDCSWNLAEGVFGSRFKGQQVKLPILLAGNPTNYSKASSLSSVEAVAAALYILNFKDAARKYLALYKWGETFLTLNFEPLEDYSKAESEDQIISLEREYFPRRIE